MLKDYGSAPLSAPEKALFGFLRKVNRSSHDVRREDVEQVRRAGVPEEAIYDAITVCALFNFYNRWCDAAGVHGLSEEGYAASGKRLAQHGYLMG